MSLLTITEKAEHKGKLVCADHLHVCTCDLFLQCLAFIEDVELDLSVPGWQEASPVARELVAAMLVKDPALRPSAQKLLDNYSSWLSQGCQPEQQ